MTNILGRLPIVTLLALAAVSCKQPFEWKSSVKLADGVRKGSTRPSSAELESIRLLLKNVPVIDGHNDLPWKLFLKSHFQKMDVNQLDLRRSPADPNTPVSDVSKLNTSIPQLKQGLVGAQFWSAFIHTDFKGEEATGLFFRQVELIRQLPNAYPESFAFATTAKDICNAKQAGKVATLIGVEGGQVINVPGGDNRRIDVLRQLADKGMAYMTLTHNRNHDWACSSDDPSKQNCGLSEFGKTVVRELNAKGVLVDISHVTDATAADVLKVTKAPVVLSHSGARAVINIQRNVPDIILFELKKNGGVAMVTFVSGYISKPVEAWERQGSQGNAPLASVEDVADHVDHIKKLIGVDHIGIGSDLEGFETTTKGLEDVSQIPNLLVELKRRGYSDQDLKKIAGLNVMRVMDGARKAAQLPVDESWKSVCR